MLFFNDFYLVLIRIRNTDKGGGEEVSQNRAKKIGVLFS